MTTVRSTGRVKWFNNKAGYGFITVTDGEKNGTDVFVHHTSVVVGSPQYTYLVQGEYVELELIPTEKESYEFQAGKVTGVHGGLLMCETRRESFNSRPKRDYSGKNDSDDNEQTAPVKLPRSVSIRGSGPRDGEVLKMESGNANANASSGAAFVQPKKRGRPART